MTAAANRGPTMNLDELRSQLAGRVALLPVIGALILGVQLSGLRREISVELVAVMVGFLALSGGAALLMRTHPRLARHWVAWGLTAVLLAAMWANPAPWLPFAGLTLVFVNAMILSGGELVTAGLIGSVAAWLVDRQTHAYPLSELALALILAAVLAWLIVRTLYTALEWAWTMQRQADETLELARDRQGELARALKALDNNYIVLRRTQRELIAARKQAEEAQLMKEQFAANVSHELRTPLNIILGFSEVMSLSSEVYGDVHWPPILKQDINQIHRSARHLLDLIDDVLDLSRFEISGFVLNKELVALTAHLRETIAMAGDLFHGRAVRLEADIPEDLPALEIDPIRIRQVLLNLLANAARFTERGAVRVAAREDAQGVSISVADMGPGIPADKLPFLFDEFYQADRSLSREHGGAGLGLAISKHFVEAHNGRIWVESELGHGATFSFTLPRDDAAGTGRLLAQLAYWSGPSAAEARAAHPLILVVDPDAAVTAMIDRHLAGYRAVQVAAAETLAEQILLHHPQAVIVNVAPGCASADALALAVPASVPVIACSLPSQAWVSDNLKVAACLIKPIASELLLQTVRRYDAAHDILVVDDDRGFCRLVERMLQASAGDYTVRRAYDGESGLAALREQPPDLLLLDLIMPDVDGFTILAAMREDARLAGIPVIVLTATSLAEDALSQCRGEIVIRRPEGLRPVEVLRCLEAVVGVLEPDYDERALPEGVTV